MIVQTFFQCFDIPETSFKAKFQNTLNFIQQFFSGKAHKKDLIPPVIYTHVSKSQKATQTL